MFDRTTVGALVAGLTPRDRGVAATVALGRLAVLADVSWNMAVLGVAARLTQDVYGFAKAHCAGQPPAVPAERLEARFRDQLGPEDDPFEEPPGAAALLTDLVALAEGVVRVWADPAQSEEDCFDVLLSAYSLAGFLADDAAEPTAPGLADREADRQLADLRAIAAAPGATTPDRLLAESVAFQASYADRFRAILDG